MSADDARLMERELDGVVTGRDLINVPNYTCYAKLTVAGTRLPVFSLTLDPPPVGDPALAAQLRAASQGVVAPKSAAEVDAELAELAKRRPAPLRHEKGRKGNQSVPAKSTTAAPAPSPPEPRGGLMPGAVDPQPAPAAPFVEGVKAKRGQRAGQHHQKAGDGAGARP